MVGPSCLLRNPKIKRTLSSRPSMPPASSLLRLPLLLHQFGRCCAMCPHRCDATARGIAMRAARRKTQRSHGKASARFASEAAHGLPQKQLVKCYLHSCAFTFFFTFLAVPSHCVIRPYVGAAANFTDTSVVVTNCPGTVKK